MKTLFLIIAIITLGIPVSSCFSQNEYVIFSIAEDVPMGTPGEVPKKNFYLNIGGQQGVGKGTTLDVYRSISRLDPYTEKKRYYFKIKIGELEVLHSEDNASIAMMKKLEKDNNLLYEINAFMIGDEVNISGIKTKTN